MEGGGQRLLNVQFFSCFLHYFRGKLRALVRDDLLGKSCLLPNIVNIELGCLFSGDSFPIGGEDDCLLKWLTTTNIESEFLDSGKSVMKSMVMDFQIPVGIGLGCMGTCVFSFFLWTGMWRSHPHSFL